MKNDSKLDARLARIEANLMHVEHQNDALNQVLVEQGKLLHKLQTQVRHLSDVAENAELDRIKANNPKPPHYQ